MNPPDIADVVDQLDAAERGGTRISTREGWSVAHCIDHLAMANRLYLAAMMAPAERARKPRPAAPLSGAFRDFQSSRAFVLTNADLDLAQAWRIRKGS